MHTIKIGLCQMRVTQDKAQNLRTASEMIARAAALGAQFVILPEMFNCPYANESFPVYAEEDGGNTCIFLAQEATRHAVHLVGGSIPERQGTCIYNTCYFYGPQGQLLAKHRKAHLFDVDVPGKISFRESDTLTPGNACTVVETVYGNVGIAVCFDIRFSEFFQTMARQDAKIIFVPGAFNLVTGPAHWELSLRMRALDCQCFTVGCSPARDESSGYVSYANSMVCNPWGTVVGRLHEQEAVEVVSIDLDEIAQYEQSIPLKKSRRPELYRQTD